MTIFSYSYNKQWPEDFNPSPCIPSHRLAQPKHNFCSYLISEIAKGKHTQAFPEETQKLSYPLDIVLSVTADAVVQQRG